MGERVEAGDRVGQVGWRGRGDRCDSRDARDEGLKEPPGNGYPDVSLTIAQTSTTVTLAAAAALPDGDDLLLQSGDRPELHPAIQIEIRVAGAADLASRPVDVALPHAEKSLIPIAAGAVGQQCLIQHRREEPSDLDALLRDDAMHGIDCQTPP